MTLSQLFLLSPRGDTIIFKDFKGNVPKASTLLPLPPPASAVRRACGPQRAPIRLPAAPRLPAGHRPAPCLLHLTH